MLAAAAAITAALMCLVVQRAGATAPCWDERLARAGGNGSCVAPQPFLIFGHGRAIHRLGLDGRSHRRLVAGVGSSVLLDFHFREERLYWADTDAGVIYTASVGGALRQKLHSSDKHITGLAVDWIRDRVYWTSGEKGEIKSMDTNGKNPRTVLRHLSKPSCIGVEPTDRFLFWLSGGTSPSVQRSDATGQTKTTLVKTADRLKALSIDREDRRLFWVQFGPQGDGAIASCDYDGNALRVLDQPLRPGSPGLAVFVDRLYYTDAASRLIKQVNKYTGGEARDVNLKRMAKPPVDIKVVHLLSQPTESTSPGCEDESGNCENVCSSLADRGVCECSGGFSLSQQGTHCEDVNECAHWNHGCSLGCENIPGSYFCTCPKGYALLPDRKTCREIVPCEGNVTACGRDGCLASGGAQICICPRGSVLQEDGQACTGCLSADRGGCSQTCTTTSTGRWRCGCHPGYLLHQDGRRCTATGPPPFLLVANQVDVRRVRPDGGGEETLAEEPRGAILAVDYDPVHGQVYFASTSKGTIERVDLSGGSRRVVVSEGLGSPEGLAVDWIHRRMYWTDKTLSTVDGCDLVQCHKQTVVSKGLERPRGIVVHPLAKRLFWSDTGSRPAVESSSLDGSGRLVVAAAGLSSPTGLALDFSDDRLFWCDQRRGLVESAALDGSDRRVLVENQVGRPFDLAVFEDSVWISDWRLQRLASVHKRTGRKLQRVGGATLRPASVVVIHPLAKPGDASSLEDKLLGDGEAEPDDGEAEPDDGEAEPNDGEAELHSVFTDKMISEVEAPPPSPRATAGPPVQVTTRRHGGHDGVESCPATHHTYCLYQGVCLYFPEMESYACNCVSGFVGERCQFSDLQWLELLELQRVEEEQRRTVVTAACTAILLSLLAAAAATATAAYCYGTRKLFHKPPSDDNVSETSVTDDGASEASTPRFCVTVDNGLDGHVVPAGPGRDVCSSCCSQTGPGPETCGPCGLCRQTGGCRPTSRPSVPPVPPVPPSFKPPDLEDGVPSC